jgi:hypothetical protein
MLCFLNSISDENLGCKKKAREQFSNVTAKTTKYLEAIHQHSSSALEGVDFPTNKEKILQTILVCSVNEGWKLKVLQQIGQLGCLCSIERFVLSHKILLHNNY